MKKIVSLTLALAVVCFSFAQTNNKSKTNLTDRAGDHFMIQFSSDHWVNLPDTISSHQKGFSRGLNIYFMLDKPFKTDPRYSVAFGLGIGTSNIFFQNMSVNLTSPGALLPFDTTSVTHFKKYKLATSFLEAPVELRYTAHPERENKSFKFALGLKVGIMLDAHTKGKNLEDNNNNVIDAYTEKISKSIFFQNTRLSATARIGYGVFFFIWIISDYSFFETRSRSGYKILPDRTLPERVINSIDFTFKSLFRQGFFVCSYLSIT